MNTALRGLGLADFESAFKVQNYIYRPATLVRTDKLVGPLTTTAARILDVSANLGAAVAHPLMTPSLLGVRDVVAKAAKDLSNVKPRSAQLTGTWSGDGPLKKTARLIKAAVEIPTAFVAPYAIKPLQTLFNTGVAIKDFLTVPSGSTLPVPIRYVRDILVGAIRMGSAAIDPYARPALNILEGMYNVAVNAVGKPQWMRQVRAADEPFTVEPIESTALNWASTAAAALRASS